MRWLARGERMPLQARSCASSPAKASSCASPPAKAAQSRSRAPTPAPGPRPRKKRRIDEGAAVSAASFIGPATETREAHLQRHGGGRKTCPRCRYYLHGESWLCTYGGFQSIAGPRGKTLWLGERPAKWGGAWGLGCTVCSAFNLRRETSGASTPGSRTSKVRARFGCAWARFDVRSRTLQSSHVRYHQTSEAHKVALAAFLSPGAPLFVGLQKSSDDDALLAGSVPQPPDWLRAWRCCMGPSSWASMAHHAQTEHFIAQIRSKPNEANAFKALVSVMAEALRSQKRQWFREASCLFLAFDDKAGRKLLCFKADTVRAPTPDNGGPTDPTMLRYGARVGVVGCMPMGRDSMSEYERDYAERTVDEVLAIIARLCTPAGDSLDDALYASTLEKVCGVVVDGALLKTAKRLKASKMPNIRIIIRDPAHIVRTTGRDPLHDAELFKEQYARLFGKRHAVMKEFQYSTVWQNQLETCQRDVMRQGGSLGDVRTSLRHLAFAQPRFESFVVPRRRYVCLLRAIAQVLATKAGDDRLGADVRARAEEALQAMSGRDCFVAGLAGDFGELCLEFLRLLDVKDHDPARTGPELADFIRALRRLFVDGYVVAKAPCPDDGVGELEAPKTLATIALENIGEPLILKCPDRPTTATAHGQPRQHSRATARQWHGNTTCTAQQGTRTHRHTHTRPTTQTPTDDGKRVATPWRRARAQHASRCTQPHTSTQMRAAAP